MTTDNRGNNMPPIFDDAEATRLQTKLSAIAADLNRGVPEEITDDTTAGQIKDRRDAAMAVVKEIESVRVEQKTPHLDASRAVDRVFGDLKKKAEEIAGTFAAPLNAYARRKDDERRATEAKVRREAAEAAKRVEVENSASAEAEAEILHRDAERIANQNTQVRSASGLSRTSGMRTTYSVALLKPVLAFQSVKTDPDVIEAIRKACERKVRANKGENPGIPGIEIHEDRKVA